MKRTRYEKGFTLVELAMVFLVLGVVGYLVVPGIIAGIKGGKRIQCQDKLGVFADEIIGCVLDSSEKHLPADDASKEEYNVVSDSWGGDLQYRAFGSDSLCDTALDDPTLYTIVKGADRIKNVAFVVWSKGRDHQSNITYNSATNTFDVTQPGDDVYTYVLFTRMFALACGVSSGSKGGVSVVAKGGIR